MRGSTRERHLLPNPAGCTATGCSPSPQPSPVSTVGLKVQAPRPGGWAVTTRRCPASSLPSHLVRVGFHSDQAAVSASTDHTTSAGA